MADVLDILELGRPGTPEVTKESIMGTGSQKPKPKYKPKNEIVRKPEGMARELFNLLVNDNKDVAPLFPTDTGMISYCLSLILFLSFIDCYYTKVRVTSRQKPSLALEKLDHGSGCLLQIQLEKMEQYFIIGGELLMKEKSIHLQNSTRYLLIITYIRIILTYYLSFTASSCFLIHRSRISATLAARELV